MGVLEDLADNLAKDALDLAARLEDDLAGLAVETFQQRLGEGELLPLVERADVVLDGTDNFAARLRVNRCCVAAATPLVSGAAVRFEGQLALFGNQADDPCYRCVYDDEDEWHDRIAWCQVLVWILKRALSQAEHGGDGCDVDEL